VAYKLIEAAKARWRKVNAPELVALVRAGAAFHKGKLLERPTDITPDPMPPDDETAGSEVASNHQSTGFDNSSLDTWKDIYVETPRRCVRACCS
jgi:hypothetical protein